MALKSLYHAEKNRKDLLDHPLAKALVKKKWKTYGIPWYLLGLLVYGVFVALLTIYALVSPNPQSTMCREVDGNKFDLSSVYYLYENGCVAASFANVSNNLGYFTGNQICSDEVAKLQCGLSNVQCGQCGQNYAERVSLIAVAVAIIFISIIYLFIEVGQLLMLKFNYLADWTNYVDVVLFIFSIIFVSSFSNCLCPSTWQWQLGSVAVFLAWINLLIYLRMLPGGLHIIMFEKIFFTFGKTILLTTVLVVAFSIAFYMIFYVPGLDFERSPFFTPGLAHIKVMTMTTGELDFENLFHLSSANVPQNGDLAEISLFRVSYPMWILFLILMPILLSNLLTGLAIDDVKLIQQEAELRSLKLRIEFALNMETLLPRSCCNCCTNDKKETITYEKDTRWWHWSTMYLYSWIFGITVNQYNDVEDVDRNKQLKELNSDKLHEEMKKTRHGLEDKMVKLQEEIKLLKYTMEGYSKKKK